MEIDNLRNTTPEEMKSEWLYQDIMKFIKDLVYASCIIEAWLADAFIIVEVAKFSAPTVVTAAPVATTLKCKQNIR